MEYDQSKFEMKSLNKSSPWVWALLGLAAGWMTYSFTHYYCPSYGDNLTCSQAYPWAKGFSRWMLLVMPLTAGLAARYRMSKHESGGRVRDALTPELLVSLVALIATFVLLSRFLAYNELKSGPTLVDPILSRFEPINVAWLTFAILYTAIIASIVSMAKHPKRLAMAMQAYMTMMLFRMFAMYLVPLDAPASIIVLHDPIIEFFGDQSQPLVKDLFFSGHTATMCILYLSVIHPILKRALFVATFILVGCILIQHVHYTIDVLAAPFFAYGAHRLVVWIHGLRRQA